MKPSFLALAASLGLLSPAMAVAQAHECSDPAPVFTAAGAGTFDLPQLAQTVGTAELDGTSLQVVANKIRADFPDANDGEVADIMITAFCTYLNDDAPADHQTDANVSAFEKQVYQTVYGGPAPEDYQRQGWLYGN